MGQSRLPVCKGTLLAIAIVAVALAQQSGRYPAHWWMPLPDAQSRQCISAIRLLDCNGCCLAGLRSGEHVLHCWIDHDGVRLAAHGFREPGDVLRDHPGVGRRAALREPAVARRVERRHPAAVDVAGLCVAGLRIEDIAPVRTPGAQLRSFASAGQQLCEMSDCEVGDGVFEGLGGAAPAVADADSG